MVRTIIIGTLIAIVAGGCAFTPANLNVGYDSAKAKAGPLSSVKALKFEVGDLADKRPQTDKIGYIRNGFGTKTANVSTTRPVPVIVREAIVAALKKNGHTVVTGSEKDIAISGSVEAFWFESQVNFWTVEFMGTIDINLVVQDGRTGQVLLSKRYSGHHNTALMSGYHKEMADVMNYALENLIIQISGDTKLVDALNSFSATPSTSGQSRL
jgi:uncharacterized lipoprotein YajG